MPAIMIRFMPLVFMLLGTTILLGLGTWQVQRLAWKEDLIAHREAGLTMPAVDLPAAIEDWRSFDFRSVRLRGRFHHDLEQIYGVEAKGGVLGHHVLTPFTREGGQTLLVDRGWVPADKIDPGTRRAGQPAGEVALEGIARYRAADRPGWFAPANEPAAGRWYHYDLAAMAKATGFELLPLVIEADAAPNPGGYPIGGGTRLTLTNNHLQYAITWYGLAAALVGVYIVFRRQAARPSDPS